MSLPRLVEAVVRAEDVEEAAAAWRNASGVEVRVEDGASEAAIDVSGVQIRITKAERRELAGLAALELAVDDLDAFAARLGDDAIQVRGQHDQPSEALLSAHATHGVSIRLIQAAT